MKKAVFLLALLAALSAGISAQELPRLAVVEFSTNIDNEKNKSAAVAMRDLVESQMAGLRQYRIMTRGEIDTLIKNQQIQVSSIASSENIQKLSIANVNYVITGSVNALGDDYSIIVRLLDVSTGEYPHSANDLVGSGSRDFVNGINGLMKDFVAALSADGDRVVQSGQGQKYNIGDRGPGGGFIFYAESGVYMEVTQSLGEFTWSSANSTVANYRGGGLSDWRLPTREELDMIYQNQRIRILAGLGGNYWSSTEVHGGHYSQIFNDGGFIIFNERGKSLVLAVRAF